MTREIGSVFEIDGVELKVEREMTGNACYGEGRRECYFLDNCKGVYKAGECWRGYRKDNENVVFIEQEKGGEK